MRLHCAMCGRRAEPDRDGDPPATGCLDTIESREGQRVRWICDQCTRQYVRSIEAKLGEEWW